ncbi:hypothetical protein FOLKNPGA_02912 [Legionella sp. PC1000]|nr:hypothetical protein FOLKNPGA_02912 [Legionella sp. PC1000]
MNTTNNFKNLIQASIILGFLKLLFMPGNNYHKKYRDEEIKILPYTLFSQNDVTEMKTSLLDY